MTGSVFSVQQEQHKAPIAGKLNNAVSKLVFSFIYICNLSPFTYIIISISKSLNSLPFSSHQSNLLSRHELCTDQ